MTKRALWGALAVASQLPAFGRSVKATGRGRRILSMDEVPNHARIPDRMRRLSKVPYGRIMDGPDFEKSALIPTIAQDVTSGKVLMLAYMNAESYAETLRTRRVCYYSRSRDKLWRKGEESGNVQHLKHLYYDCDGDTLLVRVEQVGGAACHEGYESCFFREVDPDTATAHIIAEPVFDPAEVYGRS